MASAQAVRPPARVGAWAVDIPAHWEVRQNFMGVDWMVRPDRALDEPGWGHDLLVVAHQPRRPGQSLQAATKASLKAIGHHATAFQVLQEREVRQGRAVARWVHVRMKDGPEPREAQLLVLFERDRWFTLLASTSPARYASRHAAFAAMLGAPPFQPPPAGRADMASVTSW